MKVYIDQPKIKRRSLAANAASIGGLMLLLGGVLVSLFSPRQTVAAQAMIIIGLGVAMVGIYYANRWVRKPRPEDSLNDALKSLTDSFHFYHYPAMPCDHILLSPFGVTAIQVVNLAGSFSYKDGRWKEKMGFLRAMRYIVEEHIGSPDKYAFDLELYFLGCFASVLKTNNKVPLHSMVVFTHPAVQLDVKDPPITVCKLEKLKKQIPTKGPKLSEETYQTLSDFLEEATTGRRG